MTAAYYPCSHHGIRNRFVGIRGCPGEFAGPGTRGALHRPGGSAEAVAFGQDATDFFALHLGPWQ